MDASKRKKIESAGWKVGDTREFLAMSASEMEYVEFKLALAKKLVEARKAKKMTQMQLAHRLKSSQSRVARMEAGDVSVSIDLLVRSLFELGVPRKKIEKTMKLSMAHETRQMA
jgi:ribosome-binding protein aMBF1 (putative translation factor)